jgi:formylglycine-generating enzyme required for sulfatase activity
MSVNFPLELIGAGGGDLGPTAEQVIRRIDTGTKALEPPLTVDGLGNPITNPQEYWYRCGGGSGNSANSIWYINTGNTNTSEGKTTTYTPGNIPSYVPAVVQQTERYRNVGTPLQYTIPNISQEAPLPNGTYRVNLIFSDNYRNFRVVNILINDVLVGELREESTDGSSFVGEFQSYDIEVSEGVIDIKFERVTENPKIHGIEIIKLGSTDENAFITIGNINNINDSTGYGAVPYVYEIAKYEAIRKNLNSYNADPVNLSRQIPSDARFIEDLHPSMGAPFNQAARYVNWLNEREGGQAAYKFTTEGVTDNITLWSSAEAWQLGGENRFRHKGAKYFIPSYNEWYKAAYYDSVNNLYYDYPTGSDNPPVGVIGGTVEETAVYNQPVNTGLALATNSGGLSPYGTMGQGGNISEMMETTLDQLNDDPNKNRIIAGGNYTETAIPAAGIIISESPSQTFGGLGFRVARNPNATLYTNYYEEFVTIRDTDNAADTTSYGAVSYEYQIAKYEVAEEQIIAYNLANPSLQITLDTRPGLSKPATSISWNEAARYVNWLNIEEGFQPAYNFTTSGVNDNITLWSSAEAWQTDGENRFRHKDAKYFLPSEDEWYKAAYYNGSVYFDYPTGSNNLPVPISSGTNPETAVYDGQSGPADVTQAGGLSPYGTMGQGGNTYEWIESAVDGVNDLTTETRVRRGGSWLTVSSVLRSSFRGSNNPDSEINSIGFRVARNLNANPVSVTLVTIGDTTNINDSTGYGAVPYTYQIGKYEVNEKQIDEYNVSNEIKITKIDGSDDQPVRNITFADSCRFVNWLNSKEGYFKAYSFSGGGPLNNEWPAADAWQQGGQNLWRHKDAKYFLPSENEWYKAAYYDPDNNLYNDYPTGSNNPPVPISSGTDPETSVYQTSAPASIINAGGLSSYGTMAQDGNTREWLEGNDGVNADQRYVAGTSFSESSASISTAFPTGFEINDGAIDKGFRICSNPNTKTPTILFNIFAEEIVKLSGDIPNNWNFQGDPYTTAISAKIGESVSNIGNSSFFQNTNLESLDLGQSVNRIGNDAFNGCSSINGHLSIPDSVNEIAINAFRDCSALESLNLGNVVQTIRQYAFYGCTNMTGALIIPDTVTNIEQRAFVGCSGFSSLKLSESSAILNKACFQNCSGIQGELLIPDIVTKIDNNVFNGCSNLDTLTFNANVEFIGISAFRNCSGFTGPLNIPNTVTIIESSAFNGCSGFTSLTISNNPLLTNIGGGAFRNCPGLSGQLIIPSNITSINNSAFSGCANLTGELILPSTLKSVGTYPFLENGFTSIDIKVNGLSDIPIGLCYLNTSMGGTLTIPSTIGSVGNNAFNGCAFDRIEYRSFYKPLQAVNVFLSTTQTEIHVPSQPFNIRPNNWVNGEVWNGLTVVTDLDVSNETILYDSNNIGLLAIDPIIDSLDIPDNWNENEVLVNADTLKIGISCSQIGNQAFINNTSLTNIAYDIIPGSVQTIGAGAFQNCNNLNNDSLILSEGVQTIGDAAFKGCDSLGSIGGSLTIPSSVISIGSEAFNQCINLPAINCYVEKSVVEASTPSCLVGSGISTIHVRSTDATWTAGTGQTIAGRPNVEVIKDL